jgi:hypothetical protein
MANDEIIDIDIIKNALDKVFNELDLFINGDKPIEGIGDVADFLNLLVDTLRAIIKAVIDGIPIANVLIELVVDAITLIVQALNDNQNIIELSILSLPVFPLIYIVYQAVKRI